MDTTAIINGLKGEISTLLNGYAKAEDTVSKSELQKLADKLTLLQNAKDLKDAEDRSPKSGVFRNSAKAARFYEFLAATSTGKTLNNSLSAEVRNAAILNAVAGTGNAAGAYLPADEFSTDLMQLIPQYSAAFNFHKVRNINGGTWEEIRKASRGTATWQLAANDGGTLTESSPQFGVKVITPELLYGLCDVTIRMALQSRIAVAEMVAEDLVQRIGVSVDLAVAVGDGTSTYGNITGYKNDSGVPEVAITDWDDVLENTAGYGYDKLVDLTLAVDESILRTNSPTTGFYGHTKVIASLRKMKDTQGRPLWEQSVQAGTPSKFLGYPVFAFNGLDDATVPTGSDASTFCPLLFGDPMQAGPIVQNTQGIAIASSEHVKFSQAMVEFRGLWLGSFGLIQPTAVARMKEGN